MSTLTAATAPTTVSELGLARLHLLRAGYLFMAVGLALVKWPLLPGASSMPLYEGITLCLLTAISLMALLGVRFPARLLPVLLLEVTWKLLWIGLVAVPSVVGGTLDAAATAVLVNCLFVVVVIAVIPWRHVWRSYVRQPGEPWSR
jgi:hypothetical protein